MNLKTVSFWDTLLILIGFAITIIVVWTYLFRYSKREKQALAGIDHFIGGPDGGLPEEDMTAKTENSRPLKWQNPDIDVFCRDYVTPFETILQEVGAFDGVIKLLDILDKTGDCSSIARRYKDLKSEAGVPDMEGAGWQANSRETYDVLERYVSLREHTLNVATILIEERKRESKDFHMEMGRLLFVSLGHDIGKIPTGGKPYFKKDHFIISHEILNGILPTNYPSRREILNAVRDHHFGTSSEGLLKSLKMADHEARQAELKKYSGEFQSNMTTFEKEEDTTESTLYTNQEPSTKRYEPIDLSWLDVSQLLGMLCDRINVVEKGRYEAFSHAGIVYVFPRLVAQYACSLAVNAGWMDITAYLGNFEALERLEFAVRQALSEFVPDNLIGEGYIGRKFQIVKKDGTRLKPGFYLPLKISAFGYIPSADIEKRKQESSILRSIHNVSVYNPNT